MDTTADKPTPVGEDDGSVTVTPGGDNVKVTTTFTGEDGKPQTIVSEKQPNGTWTITGGGETGATINPTTGVVTIPADKVKDGSTVTSTGTDEAGNTATATTVAKGQKDLDTSADKPTPVGEDDGSVTVTPGGDNVKVTTTFIDEDGNPQTIVSEKQPNGTWVITSGGETGATINPTTGVVTIPADKVKDGSTVTSTGTDEAGNTATATTVAKGRPGGTVLTPQPTTEDKGTSVGQTPHVKTKASSVAQLPNTGEESGKVTLLGGLMLFGAALLGRRRKKEEGQED